MGYGRVCILVAYFGAVLAGCRGFPPIGQPTDTDGGTTGASTGTNPNTAAVASLPDPTPAPPGPAPSAATPGLTTQAGSLVDANGNDVVLHGVVWGGFETGSMVTGFPQTASLTGDFATAVRRIYLLGFNTVRLPFSFKQLLSSSPPATINGACTHTLQTAVAASVTPPGVAAGLAYELPSPPVRQEGRCNDYVPSDTTLDRFVWVVQFLTQNGFYVVLADDLHNDSTAVSDSAAWVSDWTMLVQRLGTSPTVQQHLLLDLLNEPDVESLGWQASGQTPGVGGLYLSVMDALDGISTAPLFLLQGCGQLSLGTNWGDGFDTNISDIVANGLSNPTPFFDALVSRRYADRVVVAPHVFGPDVTLSGTDSSGAPLYKRLSASFGYLTQTGYCAGTHCTPFAALIGAFGSAFAQSDAEQTMDDLATYMADSAPANDAKHATISSWIYWTWEPGALGSLQSASDGSLTWSKLTYLTTQQHLQAVPAAP